MRKVTQSDLVTWAAHSVVEAEEEEGSDGSAAKWAGKCAFQGLIWSSLAISLETCFHCHFSVLENISEY